MRLTTTTLLAVLALTSATGLAQSAGEKMLLDKARSLESSGHIDLAAQTWQQLLLSDPNNVEAIAGLARAAKASGNNALASKYLDRLRQLSPNSPDIGKVESMVSTQTQTARLQQASKLAQAGQPEAALRIYREVWGTHPPDGDWALAYYDTEASTNTGREDAISGLRALAKKYPSDPRYSVTLGRILTYQPTTRKEGIGILRQFPGNSAAQAALRQALGWDAQNPGSIPAIRDYLKQHQDSQLASELAATEARQAKAQSVVPQDPAEGRAYAALRANKLDEAQSGFTEILARHPDNTQALAGMGFLRMKQGDFASATTFLEGAQQHGLKSSAVEQALKTSRFWQTMQYGTTALNSGKLADAADKYRAALSLRPTSPEALEGLAGVYMKAQQPGQAAGIYQQLVKTTPGSEAAWRGLFMAQAQSSDPQAAIDTSRRLPPVVHRVLSTDPEFLRSLASAYSATGQDALAQQVLAQALSLPYPDNGRNMKSETRLQYAALLEAGKHYPQAAGIYHDIINQDPSNVSAWQGLVSVEHQMGADQQAVSVVEQMPPNVYDAALQSSGFLSMVASIYQQQNHLDIAQNFLERAVGMQHPPAPQLELQLASIYLQRSNPQQAYAIYRRVLIEHPDHADGWKGLLSALHQTGHDREALAQISQIPAPVRQLLNQDVQYQQTLAGIYTATGNTQAALQQLRIVQAHYRAQNVMPPPDVAVQDAWLLYNAQSDRELYRELMALGSRTDLTAEQRRTVQTIWASWSVRRAGQAAEAGNVRRSQQILSAAAQAFPGNPDVSKALASGYLKSGDPKQALAIYQSLDQAGLLAAPASGDYQGMVGSALAARNMKQAEDWLRRALEQYPRDPQVLSLAARFEQARGDSARAASYWRASLDAMPQVSPANALANALRTPDPVRRTQASNAAPTDLASLLSPDADAQELSARQAMPALPSYDSAGYAAAPVAQASTAPYGPDPEEVSTPPVPVVPPANSPSTYSRTPAPQSPRVRTLGEYVPQAALDAPVFSGSDSGPLTQQAEVAPAEPQPEVLPSTAQSTPPPTLPATPLIYNDQPDPEPASEPASASTYDTSASITPLPNARMEQVTRTLAAATQPIGESPAYLPAQYTVPQQQLQAAPIYYAQQSAPLGPVEQPQYQRPSGYGVNAQQAPQQGASDEQLMQQNLPPLRGPYQKGHEQTTHTPREEAQMQLAMIQGGLSPWLGGTALLDHRTGTPGLDQLTIFEAPFEASTPLGSAARLTLIARPSFLDAGTSSGAAVPTTATTRLGTLPAGSTLSQQNAAGVGGELQLTTQNFGFAVGYTPYGFLVKNYTGRFFWHPAGGPVTFTFNRDSIRDTQLSYAGLRDPGSASPTYSGNIWGGVIANSGVLQYAKGDAKSGLYVQMGGQYITGTHVQTNNRIDGDAGSYWRVLTLPDEGNLNIGANFFGMHYSHNIRYFTYGQGGYFSPDAYVLANVPLSWTGQYGPNFHYTVNGSFGIQAFQEGSSPYFPLDPTLQFAVSNPYYPTTSSVGANYDLHSEGAYNISDHWYVGGFLSLNNSRDYNEQTVGFFVRFLSRPQYPTELGPTGLFPSTGMRPYMVP